jgi:lia operon protein LiaG
MKIINSVVVLVALMITTSMFAQGYKIPVENSKNGKLILNDFVGDFSIEGYDGKEIVISPTGGNDDDNSVPERAKGLKPIYGKGTDNTGVGIKMEKNGDEVTLTCLNPITKRREYTVKVPNNFSIKVKSECGGANEIVVQNMKNEVEVKTCHSIKIKNVSGSLVLATISGDIDVDQCGMLDQTISLATVSGDINTKFTEFNIKNPVTLATVSGEIDVTLTPKAAANVKMGTISGSLYSDFEFNDDSKKMKHVGGNQVNLPLNGGGTELNLGTISGNVYLRKGK